MSQLQNIQKELKQNIFKDYISGMDIKDIAIKYGFKHIRTCYYHLNPLKPEHKIEHMLNKAKRMKGELPQKEF
jgi:hypothetical protein